MKAATGPLRLPLPEPDCAAALRRVGQVAGVREHPRRPRCTSPSCTPDLAGAQPRRRPSVADRGPRRPHRAAPSAPRALSCCASRARRCRPGGRLPGRRRDLGFRRLPAAPDDRLLGQRPGGPGRRHPFTGDLVFGPESFTSPNEEPARMPMEASSSIRLDGESLEAMALQMPEVKGHPNRMPFSGVLTRLDTPSDRAPGGSKGKKVILTTSAAERALPSLMGMAVDFTEASMGTTPSARSASSPVPASRATPSRSTASSTPGISLRRPPVSRPTRRTSASPGSWRTSTLNAWTRTPWSSPTRTSPAPPSSARTRPPTSQPHWPLRPEISK
jgi:hypothetical protein